MIPESAGATPYGIFLLADDYRRAAKLAAAELRIGPAPVRLLAYHASELFLKTYMRSSGETIVDLREMGHDLGRMMERATALGLALPSGMLKKAKKLAQKNDYVRARYVVVDRRSDMGAAQAVEFCETIRSAVVEALQMDDDGVPLGKHWLGDLPPDYPASGGNRPL